MLYRSLQINMGKHKSWFIWFMGFFSTNVVVVWKLMLILYAPLLYRALISADLNQDGYEDLVAGAPGYSTMGHIQIGRVYVVYGNQSGLPAEDMDLDGKADQVLQGHQVRDRGKNLSLNFFFAWKLVNFEWAIV